MRESKSSKGIGGNTDDHDTINDDGNNRTESSYCSSDDLAVVAFASEERVAMLEEEAGLCEATLTTLTAQLSALDGSIASTRTLLRERKVRLDSLKSQQSVLQKSVEDNEALTKTVEAALRKCLEAYKKKMAEVHAPLAAVASASSTNDSKGSNTITTSAVSASSFCAPSRTAATDGEPSSGDSCIPETVRARNSADGVHPQVKMVSLDSSVKSDTDGAYNLTRSTNGDSRDGCSPAASKGGSETLMVHSTHEDNIPSMTTVLDVQNDNSEQSFAKSKQFPQFFTKNDSFYKEQMAAVVAEGREQGDRPAASAAIVTNVGSVGKDESRNSETFMEKEKTSGVVTRKMPINEWSGTYSVVTAICPTFPSAKMKLPTESEAKKNLGTVSCLRLDYHRPSGITVSPHSLEGRFWAGSILPSSMRSTSLLERVADVASMEIDLCLHQKRRRRKCSGDPGGLFVDDRYEGDESIRRLFWEGSCLDPMALCHRWHSPGKRRPMPWEERILCDKDNYDDSNYSSGKQNKGEQTPEQNQCANTDEVSSDNAAGRGKGLDSVSVSTIVMDGKTTDGGDNDDGGGCRGGKKRRRTIDPNAVLCPYELGGACLDPTCSYQHLDDGDDNDEGSDEGKCVDGEDFLSAARYASSALRTLRPHARFVPLPDLRCLPEPASPKIFSASFVQNGDDGDGRTNNVEEGVQEKEGKSNINMGAFRDVAKFDEEKKGVVYLECDSKLGNLGKESSGVDRNFSATESPSFSTKEFVEKGHEQERFFVKKQRVDAAADINNPGLIGDLNIKDTSRSFVGKNDEGSNIRWCDSLASQKGGAAASHVEQDFVFLPPPSSSSSSVSSKADEEDVEAERSLFHDTVEGNVSEEDHVEATSGMWWWWSEELPVDTHAFSTEMKKTPAAERVLLMKENVGKRSRWTDDEVRRLPLHNLLEVMGFSVSASSDVGDANAVPVPYSDHRVDASDGWRCLLLRLRRMAHQHVCEHSGSDDDIDTNRFAKERLAAVHRQKGRNLSPPASVLDATCFRFVAAALDGARLCTSAGQLALSVSVLRCCRALLLLPPTNLEGAAMTPVEEGVKHGSLTSEEPLPLLVQCLEIALSVVVGAEGAEASSIFACQTQLCLLAEWLRSFYELLAGIPEEDSNVYEHGCHVWMKLLAACLCDNSSIGDDVIAFRDLCRAVLKIQHSTDDSGKSIAESIGKCFRSALFEPSSSWELLARGGKSNAASTRSRLVCLGRLHLILRCASLGWHMARAVGLYTQRRGCPFGVLEILVEPLWAEVFDAFCRPGLSLGTNVTGVDTIAGAEGVCAMLTTHLQRHSCQDMKFLCGLFIMAPLQFQAIADILTFEAKFPCDSRSKASLSQLDKFFERVTSSLCSIVGESSGGGAVAIEGRTLPIRRQHRQHPFGALLAPIVALSVATAVEMGFHVKAQIRLEAVLSSSSSSPRDVGGDGMVHSQLIWSQLVMLRVCFASPQCDLESSLATKWRKQETESAAHRRWEENQDGDALVYELARRVLAFGVHPSHLSLWGDSALIRAACFASRDPLSWSSSSEDNVAGRACRHLYTSLSEIFSSKDGERSQKQERGDVGKLPEEPKAFLSVRSVPLPASSGGLPGSVLLLGDTVKALVAQHCRLSNLPETLGYRLRSLQILDVSRNELSHLPDSICDCMLHLRCLYASKNVLKSLPPHLGRLKCLLKLNVSVNRIRYFPDSISDCTQLQVIDASQNEIRSVPPALSLKLKSLHTLNLSMNPVNVG